MKTIYHWALASTIALSMASCSESFLQPDPLSFYEPGATFTTESGLHSVMATCDRHLRNTYTYYSSSNIATPFHSMYLHTELAVACKTDNSSIWIDPATRLTPTQGLYGGNNEGNQFGYYWDETYIGLRNANTVISYIDEVDLDEATRNAYLGRAYFHQAIRYMQLVFMFRDVPLVSQLISAPKTDYKTCSREAILDLMTERMEFAVEHVPAQADCDEIGVVNKEACKMLLAKFYLTRERYDEAIALMDDIIAAHPLLEGSSYGTEYLPFNNTTIPVTRNVIWDMHRPENRLRSDNTELLMGMPNRGQGSSNSFVSWLTMRGWGMLWDYNAVCDSEGKKAVTSYARNNASYNENMDYTRAIGRGVGFIRPTYYAQYGLWGIDGQGIDEGDLRRSESMGNWVGTHMLRVNNPASKEYGELVKQENCTDTIRCWYGVPQYKLYMYDYSSEANQASTQFNGSTSTSGSDGCADWYLYRSAEAYLIRAEAKVYKGDAAGAAADINKVRQRAGCKQLYTTANIGSVMDERARELFMEEWRQVEISRVSYCLAKSGTPDEWGNVYDINTYDKQSGTDDNGGSYWYQRIVHYNDFYNKNPQLTVKNRIFTIDKHNLYLPIPQTAIDANSHAQLRQNYGYDGYDDSIEMWESWEDAVASEI